jgi:hypothetical protein
VISQRHAIEAIVTERFVIAGLPHIAVFLYFVRKTEAALYVKATLKPGGAGP